jgi:hypothetical protein
MTRRFGMKNAMAVAFTLCIPILLLGCNPKMGLVVVDTNPQQAMVYVNQTKVGETPVTFELDMRRPVMLKILKEGYVPETEFLDVEWVRREHREGRYKAGDYVIQGKMQGGFEVRTKRDLLEDGNTRKLRGMDEENARRLQDFTAWCNSMVGKDYHDVVNRLGLPGETIEMPNGNKTMIFNQGFQESKPKFETDPSGTVIRWTF